MYCIQIRPAVLHGAETSAITRSGNKMDAVEKTMLRGMAGVTKGENTRSEYVRGPINVVFQRLKGIYGKVDYDSLGGGERT